MPLILKQMSQLNNKIPPPIIALCIAVLIWLVARSSFALPLTLPGIRAAGIALIVVGVSIDLISVLAFFRARTTVNPLNPNASSYIVRLGLYRVSRNPMYLGMLISLSGWALWVNSITAFLLLPLFVFYITRFQIVPEERILLEKFGEDFAQYMREVRRWL
jgi:protein-S-isoprenylcysteine O-methyltransferase Ste14